MPLHIASQRPGVVWNGSFFVHHSLALVNRELCLALLANPDFANSFDLSLSATEPSAFAANADPRFALLEDCMTAFGTEPKVTVRHAWPPDFTAPTQGHLALCQPWEFGSLPREWVANIERSVEEVWAYTDFVRQTYLESGVPADKVKIVPLGVNPARFHPEVDPFDFSRYPETRQLGTDTFKFLFVGGTIPRKGIDVLLDAYDRAFTAKDPVTLIIKDFGTHSFYANQNAGLLIRALQAKPGGARIVYLNENLSEAEIASLYAACDCLVHPYRGEGYGLPIAEAMACGKPTIVTGMGAALDFANNENAYLVPAARQHLDQTHVSGMETVSRPFWAEPDRDALVDLLRHVTANPVEATAKGARAARDIVEKHTWAHAAQAAAARLTELAERPQRAAITSYSLPMGLANFGLSALKGLELPEDAAKARYEARKQSALEKARQNDWKAAITDLETCLSDEPADWEVMNILAVAKFRTGDANAAVRLLQKGIALSTNPRDLRNNLAFILLEGGRREDIGEALEQALLAHQVSPENAEIRRTLERAGEAVLEAARRILRSYSQKNRSKAKRDVRYQQLMKDYRRVEDALGGGVACVVTAQAPRHPAGQTIENRKSQIENVQLRRQRLSLVMIVKNEERFLRNCLQSARDIVDEIVIVDTGSTDGTLDIAREFGAKVVSHAWNDDFSAARNVSLDHATGDWALWMDADEEIAPGAAPLFRSAIEDAEAEIGGFMVQFRNWLQSTTRQEGTDMAVHHACRLFRLVPGARFEGRIHEQNLRSLQNLGFRYAYQPGLILDHFGYATEIMTLRNKHERFIRMLTREVEECPDPTFHHFHLFNLGNAYFTYGDMENAVKYLRLAAEKPDLMEEFTATLYTELATALHRLGRSEEGLDVCVEADRLGLIQAGVEFARGYCLLHLKRYTEAERSFQAAIRLGQSDHVYAKSGDKGISGFKAQYGLALSLVGQDRYREALPPCRESIREQPGFTEARYLLAVILKKLEQTGETRQALEVVLQQAPEHSAAQLDLGNLLYDAGDFVAALPWLEKAAVTNSESHEIQARLAVCYEQTGNLDASMQVYEHLRFLAPNSPEICVNLGRVLAASGASGSALQCFTEAIQLDPGYGNAYFNAGDILYRLGCYDNAAETYMAGLKVSPDQPSGFFVLGNCFVQTQDYEAAVVSYRRELEQNPAHREALHNLELAESLARQNHAA